MKSFKYYCQISFIIDSKDKSLIMSIHQNLIMSKTLIRIIKKIMRGRGYLGVLRFGGWGRHLGFGIRERLTEGTHPIPMVAAREDATQGEDDDQEKGSAQGEPKGRSRCVHVGWRRKILALHHNNAVPTLVWGHNKEDMRWRLWRKVDECESSSLCIGGKDRGHL